MFLEKGYSTDSETSSFSKRIFDLKSIVETFKYGIQELNSLEKAIALLAYSINQAKTEGDLRTGEKNNAQK